MFLNLNLPFPNSPHQLHLSVHGRLQKTNLKEHKMIVSFSMGVSKSNFNGNFASNQLCFKEKECALKPCIAFISILIEYTCEMRLNLSVEFSIILFRTPDVDCDW